MSKIAKNGKLFTNSEMMRDAYTETIVDMGKKDERIMVVDVDCSRSMGSGAFRSILPEQYLNVGIMEANAVGVCAGLSVEGQIPFMNAFGVFGTRRVFDQVFLSCAYAGLNVKIIGWDAGIGATTNGGTHMPLEDIGLMRGIPGMTVVEPADPVAFQSILKLSAELDGNVYIRCLRKTVPVIYDDSAEFSLGKGNLLRDGQDVTFIACGIMVSEALKAAETLAKEGIEARVIDLHTIKPLDEMLIKESVKKTGAVVTAENHRALGGLFGAVSEYTAVKCPCPIEYVGVGDVFGEVGSMGYLQQRFELTEKKLIEKARKVIERKR